MPDGPSHTVTFLFTDIEGSTRRWEHARAAMSVALARHDAILQVAIDDAGGAVFRTSATPSARCSRTPTKRWAPR